MALNVASVDVQLAAAAAAILTAGLGQQITILKATATNTDTAARTLTLYRVPNAGTPGAANVMGASAEPIGAGETITLPLSGHVLTAQASLQGLASVASVVVVNISYMSTP